MNKEAVAMAADSTVSFSSGMGIKTFASANKVFSLSLYEPVGIMVYGNAQFMGVPWELIVKGYRQRLRTKSFLHLENYADEFIRYLGKEKRMLSDEAESEYVEGTVRSYYDHILERAAELFQQDVLSHLKKSKSTKLSAKDVGDFVGKLEGAISKVIGEDLDEWREAKKVPGLDKAFSRGILKKYGRRIKRIRKEVFGVYRISKTDAVRLDEIAMLLFTRFNRASPYMSGVVVAGFGKRDLFPSFKSFIVEGVVNGKLRAANEGAEKITLARTAFIQQFAQGETVAAFMEGAHPRYQAVVEKSIEDALREYLGAVLDGAERKTKKKLASLRKKMESSRLQVTKRIKDHLRGIRRNEFARPIVQTVAILPKDELAAMAETLVNLTSIRQRYSTEVETVGGPIDVAVISKGDGFIWIKRKHYFDKEHNPQFFARYYRKGGMRIDEEG